MIIKMGGGLEPLGPIGVYAYARESILMNAVLNFDFASHKFAFLVLELSFHSYTNLRRDITLLIIIS